MRAIKSKKAKEYIHDNIPWVYMTLAVKAILLSEKEAEERHAKEIDNLIQAQAKRIYMIQCDRADEIQKLTNRAVEAFKSACSCGREAGIGPKCERFIDCGRYKMFTQKLTKKQ